MLVASAPPLRLVYMGTAAFAVPSLRALAAGPHTVVAVYTQPARPAGRGLKARPSPVHEAAIELDLTVRTPATLKDLAEQEALAGLRADLVVVAAYGLILPEAILETPRLGCINLHASLLPRWRGAAPIQRALLAGDRETGVTVIQMEPSLDTGPILAMERVPISAASTAASLHDALAGLAAGMVGPAIDDLASGRATPRPAAGRGRHLRAQDRQVRGASGLDAARRRSGAAAARAEPVARLLDRRRGGAPARARRRARGRRRPPRRGARRPPDDSLR